MQSCRNKSIFFSLIFAPCPVSNMTSTLNLLCWKLKSPLWQVETHVLQVPFNKTSLEYDEGKLRSCETYVSLIPILDFLFIWVLRFSYLFCSGWSWFVLFYESPAHTYWSILLQGITDEVQFVYFQYFEGIINPQNAHSCIWCFCIERTSFRCGKMRCKTGFVLISKTFNKVNLKQGV